VWTSGVVASLRAWTSSEVLVANHLFPLVIHRHQDILRPSHGSLMAASTPTSLSVLSSEVIQPLGIIVGLARDKLEETKADLVLASSREASTACGGEGRWWKFVYSWPVHKHMDYCRPDTCELL